MDHSNGAKPGTLIRYLPAPLQDDGFLARFLLIFEDVFRSIETVVDNLPEYFDPQLTPEGMLPWLASWLGLELDENWAVDKRRELTRRIAELYRCRGTRRALREHIAIYAGRPPLIVENFDGLRLGQDSVMGVNARIGSARPHHISVTVVAGESEVLDENVLRNIVEIEKPAHVTYDLALWRGERDPA
jgi:phage tail-like protein